MYLLAQAVLGKHVHGEIDPHIWHSVPNAKASVQVIRDALISADPAGASEYATRTEQVVKELDALDAQLRQVYGGCRSRHATWSPRTTATATWRVPTGCTLPVS